MSSSDSLLECIEHETGSEPSHSIIWLHGLGADGNDFVPIVPQLVHASWPALRFVFPNAPVQAITINGGMRMRAWYDIKGLDIADKQDAEGILASARQVEALIARENERGVATENILLAGFSQGGAIALHTSLRHRQRLAGLVVLSSYLPLSDRLAAERSPANADVPIFWGHGSVDPVVPLILGERSRNTLRELGYSVDWHTWPMAHQVCMEEIDALRTWLNPILTADPAHASGSPENAGTRQ